MLNVKANLAANLIRLRRKTGMTQAELAEKLHYSDKAVSKWERAESVPDLQVLVQIADLFGVTLDALVRAPETAAAAAEPSAVRHTRWRNHALITAMSVALVWLIATAAFATLEWLPNVNAVNWLAFLSAAPVSLIVWLVFNSIWFNRRRNFLIISLLLWTTLAVIFLTMLTTLKLDLWLLFVIGIPAQIIILLWSGITRKQVAPNAVEIR